MGVAWNMNSAGAAVVVPFHDPSTSLGDGGFLSCESPMVVLALSARIEMMGDVSSSAREARMVVVRRVARVVILG